MTKAAMCTTCRQVIGPRTTGQDQWQWCAEPCLHTAVRWRDSFRGLLEVTSLHGPEGVIIIGLHNGFLAALPAFKTGTPAEKWREHHDFVTNAPGYLFDKSKRDCWAVVVRPGESNDTFFMPYQEAWSQRGS